MLKPFEINLSKEDIRACGRVAVWGSMLDTAMEVSIWLLLDVPRPEARKITHSMLADRKRTWLELLASSKRLKPTSRASLQAIISQLGPAIVARNRVVHGLWHIGPDGTPWCAKYNEKGNLTFNKQLNAQSIHPIAETTKKLAVRLAEWNEALEPGSMSSSFPKKPVKPSSRP